MLIIQAQHVPPDQIFQVSFLSINLIAPSYFYNFKFFFSTSPIPFIPNGSPIQAIWQCDIDDMQGQLFQV